MTSLGTYLKDFSHLVFPFNCFGCGTALTEKEETICELCKNGFPLTHYWNQAENTVEKLFWGKLKIERAASYMFFIKDGRAQSLMHHLKYNGKSQVGELLGQLFGKYLVSSPFSEVDVVIPVPLHQTRQAERGYNQCDFIASGIASELGVSYNAEAVRRIRANETQTKKGRYERYINVQELFKVVGPQFVQGKHVLLVDDVVTTGSTLEACADAILQVPETKVSIATIACPSPY